MGRHQIKYLFCLTLTLLSCAGTAAQAQQCDTVFEEITVLREPVFAYPTVWNTLYGEEGMDQFADAAPMEDGTVILAGAFTKDKEDNTYHPLLVRLDTHGRPVWEVREDTGFHKTIHRIVKTDKGVTVTGDIKDPRKGDGIYIAHYDFDGKKLGERPLYEPGTDIDAKAILQSSDGKGFIVAAHLLKGPDGKDGSSAALYKIARSGKLLWRRVYNPGPHTVFHNIQHTANGLYIVSGAAETEQGRTSAWLLQIAGNGSPLWQRLYPRGSASSIRSAALFPDGSHIVAGDARPTEGNGPPSAWIMKIDPSGNPVWQRYYTGHYAYRAYDTQTYEDGRSVVLVAGTPQSYREGRRAHVRLLTFSPRGDLLNAEDYIDGHNGHAMRLQQGNNKERIIIGHAQTSFPDGMDPDDIAPYTFDGWISVAPGLVPYEDPCTPKPFFDILQ